MTTLGEPNLSEIERQRTPGVAVLYYDDGDYRIKQFTPWWFTEDEDKLWAIEATDVMREYVPEFLARVERMRAEQGEPRHALYEVYWDSKLVHQSAAPEYEPVPLPEEG